MSFPLLKVIMKQCQEFHQKFTFYFCNKLSKSWLNASVLKCKMKFPNL
jgi:hypothetical protein